jgi:predicted chitinase
VTLGVITENGWPSCDYSDCDTSLVPGTNIAVPVQIGEPNTILKAFLADLNTYVEPYNGESDWGGWTPTNSVATSNHLGGTAVDFNWDDHPMGPEAEQPAAGWQGSSLINGDEVPAVRDLLAFYEGMVFWGDDWTTPKDSMHFQMGYGTYDGGNTGDAWTPAMHSDPKCMDFIGRKIRKDMFSVYQRGGTSQNGAVWPTGVTGASNLTNPAPVSAPVPAPPAATTVAVVTPLPPAPAPSTPSAIDVLVAATGVTADLAAQIYPQINAGLIGSQCNTINRIAMWLAQEGEESAGFTATVEIGDIDGTTYQGRTWEQITGQSNYAAFSAWAYSHGVAGVTSATYFVDNPAALGDPQYESLGAVWYWTVARPQINGLCDNGDVVGVTQAINGGQNGIDARTARWNTALAQGQALLTLIAPLPAAPTTGGTITLADIAQSDWDSLVADVSYIRAQMGPKEADWTEASSVGTDAAGDELTLRDGIAALIRTVNKIAGVQASATPPPVVAATVAPSPPPTTT